MSDMTKQWFSVAFRGLTKEKRDELIDMECAQVMGHSNVFDERDALKARVAELEAHIAAIEAQNRRFADDLQALHAAAPVAEQEPTGALIEAAEHYAAKYEGDDRQDVMTDVLNAFYQGARFGMAKPAQDERQPYAWVEQRFLDGKMVYETVRLKPMSESYRADLSRYYQLEAFPLFRR